MSVELLDNPIWHALNSRHAHLAIGSGSVRRYPAAVTPFVGCDHADTAAEVAALVQPGERIGILSVIPTLEGDWSILKAFDIWQYIWTGGRLQTDSDAMRLTEEHVPAMLELVALVYPSYFRPETAALGDYFGFFDGDRLIAMAGIRMALEGHQEISAVCTHPSYRGRGLAGRLSEHLVGHIQSQGDTPFLHTEFDNAAAQALYTRIGFERRAVLPFRVFDRLG